MLEYFDKSTKPVFKDEKESSYIKFGSMGCNDPKVKIRRGQLMLTGYVAYSYSISRVADARPRTEMVSFFQPCLDGIVEVVRKQRQTASRPLTVQIFRVVCVH